MQPEDAEAAQRLPVDLHGQGINLIHSAEVAAPLHGGTPARVEHSDGVGAGVLRRVRPDGSGIRAGEQSRRERGPGMVRELGSDLITIGDQDRAGTQLSGFLLYTRGRLFPAIKLFGPRKQR